MASGEHKEYYRNLITLVTGSAFAQLISLALSPVFSRIYTPHEFGLLAVFMSILSALSVIVCLRYEFAIIPARTGKDAFHLLELCFYSTIIITTLTLIGVTLYTLFISTNDVLSKWFWFLPLMVLINGSYQAMLSWANRHKSYKVISSYRIINSVITNIIILGAGLAGFISMGLLAGFVSGGAVAAIVLYFNIQKHSTPFTLGFDLETLKKVAKKYEAFPKVNLWQSIADMLLINGVIYFLTGFFSPAVVGLYGLTMRVLQAPFNLIGYSMGQVFIQDAAHQYNEGKNIQPIIKKSIQRTAFIALPIVLPLIFAGPQLFQFVFGEQWHQSGQYAQILAPWFFLDFIRTPLGQIPIIMGKQKRQFTITIAGNILMVISLLIGGFYFNNPLLVVTLFTGLQSLYLIYVIYWIYSISAVTSDIIDVSK